MMTESIVGDGDDAAPTGAAADCTRLERIFALDVEGMMCQNNCGNTVKRAVEATPGVVRAEVSFPARRAWAWLSPSPEGDGEGSGATAKVVAAIIDAVEDVGFGAEASPDVELLVEGMMCQKNCGTTVKNALLASSSGVVKAEASFSEARARVWTRNSTPADAGAAAAAGSSVEDSSDRAASATTKLMVEALEAVGFDARPAPTAVLEIEGMMCQKSCGSTVRGCLESVPGVERAEVSFAEGRLARVWALDGPRLPLSVLVGAVEDVGFGARVVGPGEKKGGTPSAAVPVPAAAAEKKGASLWGGGGGGCDGEADAALPKVLLGGGAFGKKGGGEGGGGAAAAIGVFSVSGMSCASCVGNVERYVSALDGVEDVRVALLAEKAEVRFNPEVTSGQALADGITGLGYPTRHLSSTVLSGDGRGDGAGTAEASDITVEISGVRGPECVAKIEAAVSALPRVASSKVVRQPSLPSTSAAAGGGDSTNDFAPVYLLTAVRVTVPPVRPSGNTNPNGDRKGGPTASGVEDDDDDDDDDDGGDDGDGDGGGGGSSGGDGSVFSPVSVSGSAAGAVVRGRGGADDAVWEALRVAYDTRGRRRHAGVRDVFEAVQGLGFGARVLAGAGGAGDANSMEASQAAEVREWKKLLLIAVGLTVPVMVLHMSDHANGPDILCGGEASYGIVLSWVLVTIVQFVVGKRFYRNAYKAAKHWSFGMDMLVVVGTSVSYLYSSLALFLACALSGDQGDRPHLFLESPAMLLTFIALGKFLEVLAKRKTSQALVFLLKAQPHRALLVEPGGNGPAETPASETRLRRAGGAAAQGGGTAVGDDGDDDESVTEESEDNFWGTRRARGWRERAVEASLVQPGDVLRVLPGSQFPTDGTLLSGRTYVDESMITGESSPVAKAQGDPVCGGTANQHGSVLMLAERVGEETMLAQLCRLVEEAQMSKAPIQRHADRVAGVFVPAVIFASLATFLGWFIAGEAGFVPGNWLAKERSDAFLFALLFGVSVVVVACPCALGLATPTAVMVGTGVGAGNGVLIKGGAALEAAHRVDTVVFDKTGTLTRGKPFLTDVVPIPSPALDRLVAAMTAPAARGAWPRAAAAGSAGGSAEGDTGDYATAGSAAAAVLALAAACEAYSEHPVARAMVDAAADAASDAAGAAAAADAEAAAISTTRRSKSSSTGAEQQQQQQQEQRPRQPLSTLSEVGTRLENGSGADGTSDFVSEPGFGVACQHPLGRVCVGTRAWGESNGGTKSKGKIVVVGGEKQNDSFEAADRIMRVLEEDGKTAVMVTVDGKAVGVVAVADVDKEGSRRTVLALMRMGLDVWMVTGDNRRVAAALATRVGIDHSRVMAEVLPADKARKVQELQLAGRHVAMVGDGVNDAPALAAADVGIAVGAGTQVAMEAADMVLVRSDVCDVVSAIHLGRKVFGRIRLNFVFAMLYNLCGVPVAAGVLYPFLQIRLPPALAGFSMAMSSISVVLSSLALRFYRKPEIDDEGKLLELSATAAILGAVSDSCNSVRRSLLWRRVLSRRGRGARRFGVVADEHDEEGMESDDVERQPLDRRGGSSSSSSSSGGGSYEGRRFYAPLARTKNASASAGSVRRPALLARRAVARAGTAAAAAAGSYSLVRSHSNRSGSVGAEEGSDVEMIGYV